MSWRGSSLSSIAILTMVALTICSCGFQPLYSRQAETAALAEFLSSMEVNTSGDGRLEQQFRTKVEDLLQNSGKQKNFRLSLTVSYLLLPVGVSPDGQVSRYNVAMKTDYNITRISDGKNFDKGSLQVQVSYNASISADYSTFISNREAIDRGTAELAEVLRSRLITAFYGQSGQTDAEDGN